MSPETEPSDVAIQGDADSKVDVGENNASDSSDDNSSDTESSFNDDDSSSDGSDKEGEKEKDKKSDEENKKEAMSTLTETQIKMFKNAYEIFDKDNDGGITVHELGEVMKALGQNVSAEELMKMFEQCDTDGSGLIEFDEFLSIMQVQFKSSGTSDELSNENWGEAFKMFDLDGDGFISRSELGKVLKNMGEHLKDYELREMIQEVDKDGDGKLSYDEFVDVMVNGIKIEE